MRTFTRTAYVPRGSDSNSVICKEIANLAGLPKLDCYNLPFKSRMPKEGGRKVKVTIIVETVKD